MTAHEEEPHDGEERLFWGSKEYPRPFTAFYQAETRSWQRRCR